MSDRVVLKVLLSLMLLTLVSACAVHQGTEVPRPSDSAPQRVNRQSLISPALLKSDLDYLLSQIEQIHPSPWQYVSRREFEDAINTAIAGLGYPMTRREFYLRTAPLLGVLSDGHSFVELPREDLSEHFFPLAVTLLSEPDGDHLFVAADLAGRQQLPVGAEILAINQAPVAFLIARMKMLVAAETEAGALRRIQLNFARYLSLMGYDSEQYVITYTYQGAEQQITTTALRLEENEASEASFYGFSRLTEQTGLLWLNDFNERPEVFSQFLTQTFLQIESEGLSSLIIDLRFNQGGLTENMMSLLSHLTEHPLQWVRQSSLKVSPSLKQEYFTATKALRRQHLGWGLQWLPLEWTDKLQRDLFLAEDGSKVTMPLPAIEPSEMANMKKQGVRVWFVTNGYCYSACAFASAIGKHWQLARVVGEPVGSRVSEQFGFPVTVFLPHSGLAVHIASTQIETNLTEKDGFPDLLLQRTREDIENKNDSALNQALREAELGL